MADSEEEKDWTTEIDSKYRLVLLAARRSKQIQKGARPRLHSAARKPTRIALDEVEHGLVPYQPIVKPSKTEE
ncbi:MAG TPA: DNA-directed RNA polymerase subunit omega [Blastocatellia bacterium]|nr:DNA-directed RNA polymerase subunit omega [Blastocatellia bacterium]